MVSSAFESGPSEPTTTAGAFTRDVVFYPGFDKRSDEPGKNYGISGGRLTFILKGPKGAIQFMVETNFYPRSAEDHLIAHHHNDARKYAESVRPSGWDVGYHAYEPQYEGQEPIASGCHILGGKCFYDGSGLLADEWLTDFMVHGTDWLWPQMEREYAERFAPANPLTPLGRSSNADETK